MIRFRLRVAAMLAWWFLLFNLDRFHAGPDASPLVYLLFGVTGISIVAFPIALNLPRPAMIAIVAAMYGLVKLGVGGPILGEQLPRTVTELLALGVTMMLARKTAWDVVRFEEATVATMTSHLGQGAVPFDQAQSEMYREVHRARQFERPVALVSIAPTQGSQQATIDHFVHQAQREAIERYVNAQVADLIAGETADSDVVSYADGRFLLLLTEADADRAADVVARIKQKVREELGLDLRYGTATFPDVEVTLTGLLERAESALCREHAETNGHPSTLEHATA